VHFGGHKDCRCAQQLEPFTRAVDHGQAAVGERNGQEEGGRRELEFRWKKFMVCFYK